MADLGAAICAAVSSPHGLHASPRSSFFRRVRACLRHNRRCPRFARIAFNIFPGDHPLNPQRRTLLTGLAAAGATTLAPWAHAQSYPDQVIKWIVPYPAGGGTDVIARQLAEAMRQPLGQSIVIDNKPGASTNIGADLVAKSKADGYTIMSADNAVLAFNEFLFS
ncbi:MAG: hypothetical protein KKC85_08885, partial [Gammaproteobacteria bacterium]|nr:hypothetical protein [Gammaproteobacteria bacterium]